MSETSKRVATGLVLIALGVIVFVLTRG